MRDAPIWNICGLLELYVVVLVMLEFLDGYYRLGINPERDTGFPRGVLDDIIRKPVILKLR